MKSTLIETVAKDNRIFGLVQIVVTIERPFLMPSLVKDVDRFSTQVAGLSASSGLRGASVPEFAAKARINNTDILKNNSINSILNYINTHRGDV